MWLLTSTWLILLFLHLRSAHQDRVIFSDTLSGAVEAGNYSHFVYHGDERISLVLTSEEGDADLFVAHADRNGKPIQPKFELDAHHLQSITCGEDRIDVSEDFARPVGISVYGHPSHDVSVFKLQIIVYEQASQEENYMSDDEAQFYEEFFGQPYGGMQKRLRRSQNESPAKSYSSKEEGDGFEVSHFLLNLLQNILHILLEIMI